MSAATTESQELSKLYNIDLSFVSNPDKTIKDNYEENQNLRPLYETATMIYTDEDRKNTAVNIWNITFSGKRKVVNESELKDDFHENISKRDYKFRIDFVTKMIDAQLSGTWDQPPTFQSQTANFLRGDIIGWVLERFAGDTADELERIEDRISIVDAVFDTTISLSLTSSNLITAEGGGRRELVKIGGETSYMTNLSKSGGDPDIFANLKTNMLDGPKYIRDKEGFLKAAIYNLSKVLARTKIKDFGEGYSFTSEFITQNILDPKPNSKENNNSHTDLGNWFPTPYSVFLLDNKPASLIGDQPWIIVKNTSVEGGLEPKDYMDGELRAAEVYATITEDVPPISFKTYYRVKNDFHPDSPDRDKIIRQRKALAVCTDLLDRIQPYRQANPVGDSVFGEGGPLGFFKTIGSNLLSANSWADLMQLGISVAELSRRAIAYDRNFEQRAYLRAADCNGTIPSLFRQNMAYIQGGNQINPTNNLASHEYSDKLNLRATAEMSGDSHVVVTLEWDKVFKIDETLVTGYKLYKTFDDGTEDEPIEKDSGVFLFEQSDPSTKTIPDLSHEETYQYRIDALGTVESTEGALMSSTAVVTPPELYVRHTPSSDAITLHWSAVSSLLNRTDISYYIERKGVVGSANDEFSEAKNDDGKINFQFTHITQLDRQPITSGTTLRAAIIDGNENSGLETNKKYYIKVLAYKQIKLKSSLAPEATSITIDSSDPSITKDSEIKIGAERLKVTGVGATGTELTVERGSFGSTASTVAYDPDTVVYPMHRKEPIAISNTIVVKTS